MMNLKWFVVTISFLLSLVVAFALGRCAGAKAHDGTAWGTDSWTGRGYDDPLLSMPTTVDTIYVPLPGKTVKEVVPVVVDTGAIIEEYFSRHVYHDTVRASAPGKLGGNAVAVISDTIAHNVIAGRKVSLTFTPNRLAMTHSVDLLSTWGLGNTSLMAGYRTGRWSMYAGYNFSARAPVAGVGYHLLNW